MMICISHVGWVYLTTGHCMGRLLQHVRNAWFHMIFVLHEVKLIQKLVESPEEYDNKECMRRNLTNKDLGYNSKGCCIMAIKVSANL